MERITLRVFNWLVLITGLCMSCCQLFAEAADSVRVVVNSLQYDDFEKNKFGSFINNVTIDVTFFLPKTDLL